MVAVIHRMMIPKKREISGKNTYLSELIIHPAMLSLSVEFLLGDGNVRAFFAMFDQLKLGGTEEDFHGVPLLQKTASFVTRFGIFNLA